MSVKEELHLLIDGLSDERALQALTYVRHLMSGAAASGESTSAQLGWSMGPLTVSGEAFFMASPLGRVPLASEQVAHPITDFDRLLGDFWPEDESADEFIAAVRQWRREGGVA